jgi:glycosyltransferase involved in cell wall biosynthesis
LIRQPTGGVAAARNAAIAAAAGDFIAPIDSDDLWHPKKLERQVACMLAGGGDVGLVYNWSRIIDERGRVVAASTSPTVDGDVLDRHLKWNFVGNGSTPLFRASFFPELHYSPLLRNAGCQGCEDYLLQLQIASRSRFACVPAFLTGYRLRGGEMSGDITAMIRSHILMFEILRDWLPRKYRPAVDRQLARQLAALGLATLRGGDIGGSLASYAKGVRYSAAGAATETLSRLLRRIRSRSSDRRFIGSAFAELSPDER